MRIKRFIAVLTCAAMVFTLLPLITTAANPFSVGQCTWYAYKRWSELLGYEPAFISGNAGGWYDNASAAGFSTGATPIVGAMACWNNGFGNDTGHVAIVETVNSDSIVVSEYNWNIEKGYSVNTIPFSSINRSSVSKPNRHLKGYIYLPNTSDSSHNPKFAVDVLEGKSGSIRVAGWAFDPDDASAKIEIHMYVGGPAGSGRCYGLGAANQKRADVGQAFGCGDDHGYDVTIRVDETGRQDVYLYALNVGAGSNTGSGLKSVEIKAPNVPKTNLEYVSGGEGNIRVTGWAFDPDHAASTLQIHVYVGGPAGKAPEMHVINANTVRNDVHQSFGCGSNHGFDSVIDVGVTGEQQIYAYAIGVDDTGKEDGFNCPMQSEPKTVIIAPRRIPVTGITLNRTDMTLKPGETGPLTAALAPSDATNKAVTWKSSDTNVATVENGVVKAVNAGSATITVTTADGGKTASCAVTVVNPTVSVTGVSLNKTTAKMTVGDSETLTAAVAPSNATNKSVTWKSSNAEVATVENGVVKAVKAGTATITVTTVDGGKTASCEVTVERDEMPYTVNSFETETPSNGRVYARISVTKNEDRVGADALVIAVYNKKGELIDTSAMQGVFEKGQTMTFRSRVFYDEGCTMKAFVWESIEDMVPISNVIEK